MGETKDVPLASLAPEEVGVVQYLQRGPWGHRRRHRWLRLRRPLHRHSLQGEGWGLTSRLATLGFTPGAKVTIEQNFGHGPIIVMVRGTRIALGRGEAQKIIVTPIAEGGE